MVSYLDGKVELVLAVRMDLWAPCTTARYARLGCIDALPDLAMPKYNFTLFIPSSSRAMVNHWHHLDYKPQFFIVPWSMYLLPLYLLYSMSSGRQQSASTPIWNWRGLGIWRAWRQRRSLARATNGQTSKQTRLTYPRKGDQPSGKAKWEWGGMVERGQPQTLVLYRLTPKLTAKRAPGPGPIRLKDWKNVADKFLRHREVILHTDGAGAYKLKIPSVIHDHVVHKKKHVKINGKFTWVKPHYTKVYSHKLPCGKTVKVKSGMQIIDRFWGILRQGLKFVSRKPSNCLLERQVRSIQWVYCHKGANIWKATGDMLQFVQKAWVCQLQCHGRKIGASTCFCMLIVSAFEGLSICFHTCSPFFSSFLHQTNVNVKSHVHLPLLRVGGVSFQFSIL